MASRAFKIAKITAGKTITVIMQSKVKLQFEVFIEDLILSVLILNKNLQSSWKYCLWCHIIGDYYHEALYLIKFVLPGSLSNAIGCRIANTLPYFSHEYPPLPKKKEEHAEIKAQNVTSALTNEDE